MTALPEALAAKVSKIIGQFGSDNPNVVTTAAAMLQRTLSSNGCNLSDLAAHIAEGPREIVVYRERAAHREPPSFNTGAWRGAYHQPHPNGTHRYRISRCKQVGAGRLSAWEVTFLGSLEQHVNLGRILTPKQASVLADICERLGVAG